MIKSMICLRVSLFFSTASVVISFIVENFAMTCFSLWELVEIMGLLLLVFAISHALAVLLLFSVSISMLFVFRHYNKTILRTGEKRKSNSKILTMVSPSASSAAAAAITPEHAQRPTARWRLRHIDSGSHTGEGFGSHCRGSLFPLLTIACDLNQRFENELEKEDGKD